MSANFSELDRHRLQQELLHRAPHDQDLDSELPGVLMGMTSQNFQQQHLSSMHAGHPYDIHKTGSMNASSAMNIYAADASNGASQSEMDDLVARKKDLSREEKIHIRML